MPAVPFNTSAIPPARRQFAQMIVDAFADTGYGGLQQLAALANAIAESGLNPSARSTPPEENVGLFQLNMHGGLGTGHTVAELEDPAVNIKIVLEEAKRHLAFKNAASLEDAVSSFVRDIERPADAAAEIARRLKIAEQLEMTG